MSDFLMAHYDADRDAVVISMQSGSEVAVMDTDEAASFADEVAAAARRESTGYEEFFAQQDGNDPSSDTGEGTGVAPVTCILTGADGENPDDCTTHDHEGHGNA